MTETDRGAEDSGKRRGIYIEIPPEVVDMVKRLGPSDEVRQHFRNARIEVLKGFRAMIDARIERISRQEQKGVKVEVE